MACTPRPTTHVETCGSLPPVPHRDVIEARVAERRGTMAHATHDMVATSHAIATSIGRAVLAHGGNAIDAFVAATLTQDIVLPGATSTAGLAGFLVATRGQTPIYVHGPYRTPKNPDALWQTGAPSGRAVLLPGEPFALLEAQARWGKLPRQEVLRPVIELCRHGFAIDALFAAYIDASAGLRKSPYALRTYFVDGKALPAGALLKLPELGDTLQRIAEHGAAELTSGQWAHQFVDEVTQHGGLVTLDDLADLRATFLPALHLRYRNHDIYGAAGLSFGGRKLLTTLALLERVDLAKLGPIERSAATLRLLLRTQRAIEAEGWIYDASVNGEAFDTALALRKDALWAEIDSDRTTSQRDSLPGHHSASIIVVDDSGMIVAGTHTSETLAWADALFAGGIVLGSAARSAPNATSIAGGALPDPLTAAIVYDGAEPRIALAVFGTGLYPADVQIITGMLDFGRDAESAVLAPRLGWFVFDDARFVIDKTRNLLDPRVDPAVICQLGALGRTLQQTAEPGDPPGMLDLGFPTVVELSRRGHNPQIFAMTPEWMSGAAAGD